MRPATLLLLAAVILSNVAGNFILTLGMKSAPPEAGPVSALWHPLVIAGIILLICWTLLRMKLLGIADLSFVLPVTAVGYVLNAVAGAVLLQEQVSPQRWAGTLLIVAGAALTARTAASTEESA